MTEQQPYEVLEEHDAFELRRYPPHVVAEVELDGSFEGVGNRAFGALFGYITGRNEAQRSVAMTAPVVQEAAVSAVSEKVAMTAPVVQTEAADGSYLVAFVLPASMTIDTAPVPTNPDVRIMAVPERLAAAVAYSGRWTRSSYERHLAELLAAVTEAGFVPVGSPRFARFDPPFKPWFLRRNEVVRDVTLGSGASDAGPVMMEDA
ncbi:heme-binding protein [Fodinibacter luteus]|uniref:Heme-binding protein n=1 Tax=Fodinibacter luteus TaxID=552064 RepID=A0ABP8KK36_9MICO